MLFYTSSQITNERKNKRYKCYVIHSYNVVVAVYITVQTKEVLVGKKFTWYFKSFITIFGFFAMCVSIEFLIAVVNHCFFWHYSKLRERESERESWSWVLWKKLCEFLHLHMFRIALLLLFILIASFRIGVFRLYYLPREIDFLHLYIKLYV